MSGSRAKGGAMCAALFLAALLRHTRAGGCPSALLLHLQSCKPGTGASNEPIADEPRLHAERAAFDLLGREPSPDRPVLRQVTHVVCYLLLRPIRQGVPEPR